MDSKITAGSGEPLCAQAKSAALKGKCLRHVNSLLRGLKKCSKHRTSNGNYIKSIHVFSWRLRQAIKNDRRCCDRYDPITQGNLLAPGGGNSRFQNGGGGGKDVHRVLAGDFFSGFQPVLDVAPAELCP